MAQPLTEMPVLGEATVQDFRAELRGELIRPGDGGYESARRVWNGMIDRRPCLIARCAGTNDVITAMGFARSHHLPIAVRGGGHNVAGHGVCDGGIVIDLSPMKGVRVDPTGRTARAEAGLTWGEFDRETQAFGLATTGGTISTTGIAGLTLGGGDGWLMNRNGLTIDNLLSVDLVTADGQLLRASETENPDLFWGLRGGGGNFGIATSFEYRLHPVGPVLGGMVLHPAERAREVLRFYREFTATAPDELTVYAVRLTTPDGMAMIALALCYCGSIAKGERVVAPLRRFGPPAADLIQPMPYPAVQTMLDEAFPPGQLHYWKANLLPALSDEAIETIVGYAAGIPSPMSAIVLVDHHGAVRRVGPTDTAYSHRTEPYDFLIVSVWTDPAETERQIGWTREFWRAMQPVASQSVYANLLTHDEGADRVRAAYGGNYDRLVALKRRYDPTNVFRLNQNIDPTAT